MDTKLTLRLEDNLIRNAKKYAKGKGSSLSIIVSNYFRSILINLKEENIESPVLSEIAGILSPRADNKKLLKSYKKHIEEKYL
ncbi:MAG: DUF6364 family protein [bacterium]